MTTPFLDVPVYRLREADYYELRKEHSEEGLKPLLDGLGEQASDPRHQPMISNFREHLNDVYGGIWRFNEIIGYIRLHFLGTQLRGEYFSAGRSRIVRTRKKRFEWRTHKLAMESEIQAPLCDASILTAVREYLARCQREVPGRHIDVAILDVLAPHLRWYDLWKATNPFTANEATSDRA